MQNKIDCLEGEVKILKGDLYRLREEMSQLQRNVRRHSFDFNPRELVIENIDAIICEQG